MVFRKKKPASPEDDLKAAVNALRKTIESVRTKSPHLFVARRRLTHQFMLGIMHGLGLLVAAAIVIPFLIALLKQVEWIPMIGDVLTQIEQVQGR